MHVQSLAEPALRQTQFINNEAVKGTGATLTVVNPATEETVATFAAASPSQVDIAVKSARRAFDAGRWSFDSVLRRDCLAKLADLMAYHREILMDVLISEIGTPANLIANHIDSPAEYLRFYAEAATTDRTVDLGVNRAGTGRSKVLYRPVGVVAAITAYNYPLLLTGGKIGAALSAGCTVVLLSSPLAPLTVRMLGELIREAGFPAGVVNIVSGAVEVGKALTEHRDVDLVSFTGSVAVGREVMKQAAQGLRGVVLELGGKGPAILLPGTDYERYAFSLNARYARHAGQGCGSPTRILVEESRFEEFVAATRAIWDKIIVGDPRDKNVIVGPLITKAHRERVESAIEQAVASGARVLCGGGRPDIDKGWFLNPVLLGGIDNSARIAREELFGPVSVVLTYRTVEEAIAIANDSDLGLKAYLYGDTDQCERLAPRISAGTVVINNGGGHRPDAPMCGYRQSGIGSELGEAGISEYLVTQHIDVSAANSG